MHRSSTCVESSAKSYDNEIFSLFLVTNTEKTKNDVLNDASLLQLPFNDINNQLTNNNFLNMFDLKDIFKESVFYPINNTKMTQWIKTKKTL